MPKRRASTASSGRKRPPPAPRALRYKVLELSNVDEAAIEAALNEWVPRGWAFDGVQFAMRESSKRPAMAFLFFTREGAPLDADEPEDGAYRSGDEAVRHLTRLAKAPPAPAPRDAWARLRELAGEGGPDDDGAAS